MKEKELIDKTNEAIAELVYNKYELQKAYNYYNGKRDPEQFRYLEENFGIGSPTSVEFTPLLKNMLMLWWENIQELLYSLKYLARTLILSQI